MKITVAIPAYKPNFLYEAIESVINQSYTDWELIIINDHSPYNISNIVNSVNDERIKYFVNDKNCGAINVVDNWNKCLKECSSDYIVLMGDDDKLPKESLANYVKLINENPGYDIYHGRSVLIDENSNPIYIQDDRPTVESLYEAIWERMDGRQQFIGDYLFRTNSLRKEGGFFKLPLAWGSDDISVFRAIGNKGIANTNELCFCYRSNRFSISSSGNSDIKMDATFKHKKWLQDVLLNSNVEKEDGIIKSLAIKRLSNYFIKKRIHIVAEDIAGNGFYRFFRWITRRGNIQLSFQLLVLALMESIKLKKASKV